MRIVAVEISRNLRMLARSTPMSVSCVHPCLISVVASQGNSSVPSQSLQRAGKYRLDVREVIWLTCNSSTYARLAGFMMAVCEWQESDRWVLCFPEDATPKSKAIISVEYCKR